MFNRAKYTNNNNIIAKRYASPTPRKGQLYISLCFLAQTNISDFVRKSARNVRTGRHIVMSG